jgi:hypothetical protein
MKRLNDRLFRYLLRTRNCGACAFGSMHRDNWLLFDCTKRDNANMDYDMSCPHFTRKER